MNDRKNHLTLATNNNQNILWLFEFEVLTIKEYTFRTMHPNGNTKKNKNDKVNKFEFGTGLICIQNLMML